MYWLSFNCVLEWDAASPELIKMTADYSVKPHVRVCVCLCARVYSGIRRGSLFFSTSDAMWTMRGVFSKCQVRCNTTIVITDWILSSWSFFWTLIILRTGTAEKLLFVIQHRSNFWVQIQNLLFPHFYCLCLEIHDADFVFFVLLVHDPGSKILLFLI